METLRNYAVVALIAGVLGGATLMYCDSPGRSMSAESQPPISYVAERLTLPVPFANASEIRAASLPIGTGLLFLILAVTGTAHPLSAQANPETPRSRKGWFASPLDQLVTLSTATLLIAVISSLSNDAWALSRGWCFTFGCGALWAIGLATAIRARGRNSVPRLTLVVIAILALAACGLTLWHREKLDIQYVRWPIGPLTVTGSMAGVWAAVAIGGVCAASLARPRRWHHMALALPVLVLAAMLAYVAGRRGSALGVAAAMVGCILTLVLSRMPARTARWAVMGGLAAFMIAVGAWLSMQMKSTVREVSGSIALRQAYYGSATRLIGASPLLGIGPDMTICRVTTDLARDRAEHPHVIHGNTVPALHNEWLQALLELGIPGGLLYLAIPLTALVVGARTWVRVMADGRSTGARTPCRAVYLFAALAGLTAVVVIEATSINLRGPVMSATYWTLLGLAVGVTEVLSRPGATTAGAPNAPSRPNEPSPTPSRMPQVLMAGLGAGILLLTFGDLQKTYAHAEGRSLRALDPTAAVQRLDIASDRFGAEHWLAVRVDRGLIESEVSRDLRRKSATSAPAASQPTLDPLAAQWTDAAIASWEQLLRRCTGYPGAGGFLGEALLGAGRSADAKSIFEGYLAQMDPYDQAASLMYAVAFVDKPMERIRLVRRGLRAGAVEPIGRRMFLLAVQEPGVFEQWAAEVAIAAADAESRTPETWQDPLAPETLRMEAVRLLSKGELTEASSRQDAAARIYDRLYLTNHPLRRAAPAEIDAWKIAADVRFESDPGAYREAFERVLVAERFAVLSVEHEYRRNPPPDAEFVGGVVTPVETPDGLTPLWRLSAKLHIAVGRTQPLSLLPRLHHAISTAQREAFYADGSLDAAAQQLQFRLIAELFAAFQRVPPEQRPPQYPEWAALLAGSTATALPAGEP